MHVSIVTSQCWLVVVQWWVLGGSPMSSWVLGYPPEQLLKGNNGAISQLVKLSLNFCRWEAYPIWGCCNVANFNIFFVKEVEMHASLAKVMHLTPIPPVTAETLASVQQFLQYLFTYLYTYLIYALATCPNYWQHAIKMASLGTINNWLLNFLVEFVC